MLSNVTQASKPLPVPKILYYRVFNDDVSGFEKPLRRITVVILNIPTHPISNQKLNERSEV